MRVWGALFRGSLLVLCAHQYLTGGLLHHRESEQGQKYRSTEYRILALWALTQPWQLQRSVCRQKMADQEGCCQRRAFHNGQSGGYTPEAPPGRSPACPRQWGVEGLLAGRPAESVPPSLHKGSWVLCWGAKRCRLAIGRDRLTELALTSLSLSFPDYRAEILSAHLAPWSPGESFPHVKAFE